MKKYIVEFNTSGFMYGAGIFEVLDETAEVQANSPADAIELCIDFMIDSEVAYLENEAEAEALEESINDYAWRAAEISEDYTDERVWYDRYNNIV